MIHGHGHPMGVVGVKMVPKCHVHYLFLQTAADGDANAGDRDWDGVQHVGPAGRTPWGLRQTTTARVRR